MKTQLSDLRLPSSVWQSFHQIDNLMGRSLPWLKRLDQINAILLTTLDVDAVWLLTIKPLPAAACGIVRTPLSVAPNAQVEIIDQAPPIDDIWPQPDSLLGQVIASKQPYFVHPNLSPLDNATNGQTDSDLGDVLFGTFNTTPAAIVPLVSSDQPVGALIVASHDLDKMPLSAETQNVLIYLGTHLGATLQNAHLLDQSRRHANAMDTLNQIANTITSSLDLDEVLRRTMGGINEMLDVEAGSILLVDEVTSELYFKLTLRGENPQITSFRLKWGEGLAGWVVANNQPTISNHAQSDKRFYHAIDEAIGFETKTVLCVPLVVQGIAIGAIEVINKRSGQFDRDDMELLTAMAAAVGIALENANLVEEAQERAQHHEMINQIVTAANAGYGLSETGRIIFEQLGRLLPFHHLSVSLLDSSPRDTFRQWTFSQYGAIEHTKSSIPLKDSALAHLIELKAPYLEEDISAQANRQFYPDEIILREDRIKTKVSILLSSPKGPFGSLNLGYRQAGMFSQPKLNLLNEIVHQISTAIEKAWLIDVMERRANELQTLNHLGEMLSSTTDLRLIMDTTLNMLPRLLGGDVQGVIIAEDEGCHLGVAVPYGFTKTEEIINQIFNTYIELKDIPTALPLLTRKSIPGNVPVPANWQPVSVLSLPVLTRQGLLGVIYRASGKNEQPGDDVLRIFSLVVSQITAAVENAFLFRQVEQERARLAAILASSTDAVLVVDRHGRIVLDNPASWDVLEVENSQSEQLLTEVTQNKTLIQLFEAAMQGDEPTGEIPLMDGRTFFANLSPVSTGEAGVIGWVATMQDVSHFKELNEMKSDFVNAVSHDLRSPLSGILIATHLIPQLGLINEAQHEMLETVENRVKSMSALIDDLLDVGKIEAGIDIDMEPCPISPIIGEVIHSLMHLAENKPIQLISQIDNDLPLIMANSTRLRQVMNNLISNAIKYTHPEGRVVVKGFRQDNEIRIQVIDDGIGIPATDQPHIFEKFYRVRGDHMAGIKGTGLGLALAKGIVEKHRGRIWLESVLGEGSTFTIALPIFEPVEL
jgi:PAS domain S-box-containing protein